MLGWKRRNQLGRVLYLGIAAIAFASQAAAIPITSGLELDSLSGNLRFSNFSIFSQDDLGPSDIAALDISATENGIRIDGPLTLLGGAEGAIQLFYEVSVLSGPAVNGVTLSSVTEIVDGGFPTFAKTAKLVFEDPIGETLGDNLLLAELVTRNFQGEEFDLDMASFAPQTTFTILDTIRLSSGGPGGVATFDSVRNDFAFVPEPTSLILLSGGLLGLVFLGSRPRQRP
jgi:hypothetical protein